MPAMLNEEYIEYALPEILTTQATQNMIHSSATSARLAQEQLQRDRTWGAAYPSFRLAPIEASIARLNASQEWAAF